MARRFDDVYTAASPAAQQYVARRFDDVINGHQSPKLMAQKLAREPVAISTARMTTCPPHSPCIGSRYDELSQHAELCLKPPQTLVTHAAYSRVTQQVSEQVDVSQTYIQTGVLPRASEYAAEGSVESCRWAPAQHHESTPLTTHEDCINTTTISQQVRSEYAALVAGERQAASGAAAYGSATDRGISASALKALHV